MNMATYLNGKKNIRLLSLGTGDTTFKKFGKHMDKKELLIRSGEFMMSIDDYNAQGWIKNYFKYIVKREKDYVRV